MNCSTNLLLQQNGQQNPTVRIYLPIALQESDTVGRVMLKFSLTQQRICLTMQPSAKNIFVMYLIGNKKTASFLRLRLTAVWTSLCHG